MKKKKNLKYSIRVDIPFPKSCSECNLYDNYGDYPTCYVTKRSMGYNFNIFENRMPDCPLYKYLEK